MEYEYELSGMLKIFICTTNNFDTTSKGSIKSVCVYTHTDCSLAKAKELSAGFAAENAELAISRVIWTPYPVEI